eukprot:gene18711-44768_t
MGGACGALIRRSFRETDTPEERAQKRSLVPTYATMTIVSLLIGLGQKYNSIGIHAAAFFDGQLPWAEEDAAFYDRIARGVDCGTA